MPLRAALAQHAETQPHRVAVSIGTREVTYRDLYQRSQRLDAFFASLPRQTRQYKELSPIPLIAVHLGNHSAIPEILAAALAGSCCVMLLDPLLPMARIQDILKELPPDAILTASANTDFKIAGPVFTLNAQRDLDTIVAAGTLPAPTPRLTSPFMVAFTSGTTSTPKAFARNRITWQSSLSRGKRLFSLSQNVDTLSPGPLVHGLSLYAFAETLEVGATFHTMEKFNTEDASRLISDRKVKRLVCVPTMLEALSRVELRLPQLAQITTAGAKLSEDLLARTRVFASSAEIVEYCGASELGFVSSITRRVGNDDSKSLGAAFPEVQIAIRNPDAEGNGEIWIKSDLVIEDYLWRKDEHGFQRDGDWSTVGDIGRLVGGQLYLTGRSGGMVTSGGNNIYLDEVATHLKHHPSIDEAIVLGLEDNYLGTKLVAVIQSKDKRLTADGLSKHCLDGLQKYKKPRSFYTVQRWPMTSSGKIATGQVETWLKEKDSRIEPLRGT